MTTTDAIEREVDDVPWTTPQPVRIDRLLVNSEEHVIDPPVVVDPSERLSLRIIDQYLALVVRRDIQGRRYWWKPWKRRRYVVERQTVIYSARVGSDGGGTVRLTLPGPV